MQLAEKIMAMREDALARGEKPVPDALQGVTKDRIAEVLRALDLETPDQIDAVFALLDNERRSWFTTLPDDVTFSAGATIAHVGCHVGILQRGKAKLDREGRDYWVRPLREIGAIEAVYLDSKSKAFLRGHPKAKSPNSAYRLVKASSGRGPGPGLFRGRFSLRSGAGGPWAVAPRP